METGTIQEYVKTLSALANMDCQIWDPQAKLVYSTNGRAANPATKTIHRQVVKEAFLKKTFAYAVADGSVFACALPPGRPDSPIGIVSATGPIPPGVDAEQHPGHVKALLEQAWQRDGNGVAPQQPSKAPEAPKPESSFDDLYLFANVSKQFRSLRLKSEVLEKLMQRLLATIEADVAFLHLSEHTDFNQLVVRSSGQADSAEPRLSEADYAAIVAAGVESTSGTYRLVDDSREDKHLALLSDRPFRFVAVSVRHMKQKYGCLGLVSHDVDTPFRSDGLSILQTLANQLAVMMANMTQYDELEQFTINIVCSLVNAIEAKDAFFSGHSKRVHQYVMRMAEQIELPQDAREALKWAALLHDVGKIGIPEKILRKPEKLSSKEYDLIKQHPKKGCSILAPIRQLQPSMDAIAHHHESYDGSGYPDGLQSDAIPLLARMIAVADTFDAITSKRSYRVPKTAEHGLQLLDKLAGTQLDPQLVLVFRTACAPLFERNKSVKKEDDPF